MDDRARRGVGWLTLVSVATKGSQLVVTVVLAALFTEADLGVVALTLALVNTAMVVQSMGVTAVISRTEHDAERMAGTVLTMTAAAATLLTVAGVAGAPALAGAVDAPAAAPLIRVVSIGLPFMAIAWVQLALMSRGLNFRQRLVPDIGSAIGGAAVTVGLALAGAGPMSVAVGFVVTAASQPVLGVAVGVRVRPRWDRRAAGEAFRWIATVGAGAIAATVVLNIDYPIVSRILGPDALGLYSLAFRLGFVPYALLGTVLASVAFALYANLMRDGDRAEAAAANTHFTRLLLLTVGGTYVVAVLLADRIVLLGDRWAAAAPALMVLCGYGLGRALLTLWYESVVATGRLRLYTLLECAHLILLAMLLVTFTRYGIVAAALAQAGAVWTMVATVWIAARRAHVAPAPRDLVRAVGGFAVPAVACVLLSRALHPVLSDPRSLPAAAGEAVALIVCYGVVAVVVNRAFVTSLLRHRQPAGT